MGADRVRQRKGPWFTGRAGAGGPEPLPPLSPAALADLDAVYAALPKVECQKKCYAACGPISMTRAEAARIEAVAGFSLHGSLKHLLCPLLTRDGLCSVYELRPFICRLWGAAPTLPCDFGCKPDREMTPEEDQALWERYKRVAGEPLVHTATRQHFDQLWRLRDAIDAEIARRAKETHL